MPAGEAVPFASPESLAVTVTLPNRGPVRGMGVREGVTLVVGGGFHGKTTLLRAIELGVYNKVRRWKGGVAVGVVPGVGSACGRVDGSHLPTARRSAVCHWPPVCPLTTPPPPPHPHTPHPPTAPC